MASACLIYRHNANGWRWFQTFFLFRVLYSWLFARTWGEIVWSEKKTCNLDQFGNVSRQYPTTKKRKTHNFGSALGSESCKLTLRQENQEYACSYVRLLNCQPQINFANHKALPERLVKPDFIQAVVT